MKLHFYNKEKLWTEYEWDNINKTAEENIEEIKNLLAQKCKIKAMNNDAQRFKNLDFKLVSIWKAFIDYLIKQGKDIGELIVEFNEEDGRKAQDLMKGIAFSNSISPTKKEGFKEKAFSEICLDKVIDKSLEVSANNDDFEDAPQDANLFTNFNQKGNNFELPQQIFEDEESQIPCHLCQSQSQSNSKCRLCKGHGKLIYTNSLRKIEKIIDNKLKALVEEFCGDTKPPLVERNYTLSYFKDEVRRTSLIKTMEELRNCDWSKYICNICQGKVVNVHYHCSQCGDLDYCEKCEKFNSHQHPLWKIKHRNVKNVVPEATSERRQDFSKSHTFYIPKDMATGPSKNNPSSEGNSLFSSQPGFDKPAAVTFGANSATLSKSHTKAGSQLKSYKGMIISLEAVKYIKVTSGEKQKLEFSVKNTGDIPWPASTTLVCISGLAPQKIFETVGALRKNEDKKIVFQLDLSFMKTGSTATKWRLNYMDETDNECPFGNMVDLQLNIDYSWEEQK